MSDPADRQDGADQAARDYAWSWFKYHAAQRQTVFRFFMTAFGAVIGGYVTTHVSVFGLALAVLAFLFWRLDKRNRLLIKFAEDYLYKDEAKLAIRGTARWWRFASFGQVYDVSFLLLGVTGLALFVKG